MSKDTKNQILAQTELAMRRTGFEGVSFRTVAAAVGIKSASIHYHFPTKSALAEATMQRYRRRFFDNLGSLDSAGFTPQGRIGHLSERYLLLYDEADAACLYASLAATPEVLPDDVRLELSYFYKELSAWVKAAIAPCEEVGVDLIVTALQGASLQCAVQENATPILQVWSDFNRLLGADTNTRRACKPDSVVGYTNCVTSDDHSSGPAVAHRL